LRRGFFPYIEGEPVGKHDLEKLLHEDKETFWKAHLKIAKGRKIFSDSFKELFEALTETIPENRPTVQELKSFEWFKGPVYDDRTLKNLMT